MMGGIGAGCGMIQNQWLHQIEQWKIQLIPLKITYTGWFVGISIGGVL